MRWLLAAAIVALGSGIPAMAQSQSGTATSSTEDSARRDGGPRGRVEAETPGVPLPSIGLPLPTIGLPHPPTGLPPATAAPPPGRSDRRPGPAPNGRRGRRTVVPVFVPVPVLIPGGEPGDGASNRPAETPASATPGTGRVLFDVKPAAASAAQLYVDGYYVGTPADYRLGLELPAGDHVVEVHAQGFRTDTAPLNVSEDRVVSHRVTLAAAGAPAPDASARTEPEANNSLPSSAAPSNRPYYFIRGCYLGNVPPAEVTLPPGCDPANAVVVRP